MLSSTDNNFPAVEQNLHRARGKWGHLAKILGMEGVDNTMKGGLYVVVSQVVLLFGSEPWVLTPPLEKALEGFHHQSTRRMVDMGPKRHPHRTWI